MTDANQNPEEINSSDRGIQQGTDDQSDASTQSGRPGESSVELHGTSDPDFDGSVSEDDALTGELEAEVVEAVARIESQLITSVRSAPLPEVSEFAGYDQVLPGAAERILAMAEKSLEASTEATMADAYATRAAADSVRQDANAVKRGQIIFGLLAAIFMILALIAALSDKTLFATVATIAGIGSVAGAYIRPVNEQRWRPVEGPTKE